MSEVTPKEDLVQAILNGSMLQRKHLPSTGAKWTDMSDPWEQQVVAVIQYTETWQYRVKPEPVMLYAAIIPSTDGPHLVGQSTWGKAVETAREIGGKLLTLQLDPDTFELISTEVTAV